MIPCGWYLQVCYNGEAEVLLQEKETLTGTSMAMSILEQCTASCFWTKAQSVPLAAGSICQKWVRTSHPLRGSGQATDPTAYCLTE